jgi:DNA repair exonuclease SbcCD ATPase subunit
MRIRDIQVENFRKLRHAEITGLQDGANVISGDNEAGKSTLLAAVQAGLFQRHNITGKTLDSMQPFGCAVRPQVHVVFDLGVQRYTLRKTFGAGCSAELIASGGQRWANHDADRRLEEMLRFQAPSRGASRFSELGMWPLFWVEQGSTFQDLRLNPDVRATVHTSLRKEVGDILVGENGKWLKQRIQTLCSNFFTPGGRETGALTAARKQVDELQTALETRLCELQSTQETVTALEEAEERLSRLEAPRLRADLQRQREAAEREAAEIQLLLDRKIGADRELRIATMELDKRLAAVEQRTEMKDTLRRLTDNREKALRVVVDARDAHNTVYAEQVRVAAILDSLREQAEAATRTRIESGKVAEYTRAGHFCDGLRRQVEKGREVQQRVLALEAELAELRITRADLDHLQRLDGECVRAHVSLESAATRVEINPGENAGITLGGVPVVQSLSLLLTEVTDVRTHDVHVRITPGGDDLESRRSRVDETLAALSSALAKMQAGSVSTAVEIVNRREVIESELAGQNRLVRVIVPEGFEALLHNLSLAERRLATLQSELPENIGVEAAQSAFEEAERTERALRSEVKLHESTLILTRDSREENRNRLTAAETEVRVVESELERARVALEQARASDADETLNRAVSVADESLMQSKNRLDETVVGLANADPDKVSDQLRMSKDALDLLSQQISDERQRVHRLRGAVEALGHKGLAEECSDAEAKLVFARLRLKAAIDEASALRVLAETIVAVEKATNERFLQPVVARVQPYLNRVLPGTRLSFDESLGIEGLQRGMNMEPYECISVGAREQISVITRIAFADLLGDEGLDAPIILDDALAYSDERRFGDTLSAIASAAKRHQIILLTCHDERYVRLGARTIRLDVGARFDAVPLRPVVSRTA